MRKLTLEITLGNEEMKDPEDIAEALRRVANQIHLCDTIGAITDANGNRVGRWEISPNG